MKIRVFVVRDQEAGGSNPLAPTISFNNLQVVAGQTAHPTAHPVVKLRLLPFVPILRAWRRTQPRIPPRRRLLPTDPPLQAPHSLPPSRSTFATSVASRSQRS